MLRRQRLLRALCMASASLTRQSACSGYRPTAGALAGLCGQSSSSLEMTAGR